MLEIFKESWGDYFWLFLFFLVGAFLLAMLLRWLFWERGRTVIVNTLEQERNELRAKNTDIEKELATARYRIEELLSDLKNTRTSLNKCDADRATLNAQLSRARSQEASDPPIAMMAGGGASDDKSTNESVALGGVIGAPSTRRGTNLKILNGMSDEAIAIYYANGIETVEELAVAKNDDLVSWFKESPHNYYFGKRQAKYYRANKKEQYNAYRLNNYALALRNDNLQVVEGIGPKIETLLKNNGVHTWEQLANAPYGNLKATLDKGGKNYRIHDPKTWAQQAQLAHNDKWEELYKFQKFLDTGRDSGSDGNTPAKIEKLMTKVLGVRTSPNNLKVVEGIGPKIEQLLKADGIQNWSDLAQASTERLQSILSNAGKRFRLARPATWAKQATLAKEGKWAELREYQDFLRGGNDPA